VAALAGPLPSPSLRTFGLRTGQLHDAAGAIARFVDGWMSPAKYAAKGIGPSKTLPVAQLHGPEGAIARS
jgi:hypothetical protein